MKYIYLIFFNTNLKKTKSDDRIYKLNRYSILLNDENNIPLLQISNNKTNYKDLVLFYLKRYVNLNYNPIIDIKLYKKYKNIEYLFIVTDNFIEKKINNKYKWKHFIDMSKLNSIMDTDLIMNINKNNFIHLNIHLKDIKFKDVVKWYYSSNYC